MKKTARMEKRAAFARETKGCRFVSRDRRNHGCGLQKRKKVIRNRKKEASLLFLGQDKEQCDMLEKNVREGFLKFYMEVPIDRVSDPAEIQEYGVTKEPALLYVGRIISEGKILERNEIMSLIANR